MRKKVAYDVVMHRGKWVVNRVTTETVAGPIKTQGEALAIRDEFLAPKRP